MITEDKALYDGWSEIRRGMDSGNAPSLIGPDQLALMVNAQTRRGYIENRPGWFKHSLNGDDIQLGRFQRAAAYNGEDGRPFIIATIGGQVLRIDPMLDAVLNLSVVSGNLQFSPTTRRTWLCQAETYMAIQNNSEVPFVFDGAGIRLANPVALGGDEFPIGNAMEYNNGRLWVALTDGRTFGGGDLAYSDTGTAADVLKWTQNTFLTGGAFAMPSNAGTITAMKSLALQDSVLGQGPLIVFGQYGAASVNAPFNAEEWQTTDSPVVAVGLLSQGPTSQEATIGINGDLWYRSRDGVRTYMVARRDHNTWVNTPVSNEMKRILERDDQNLLRYASAVDFDNRHLLTVSPFRAIFDGVDYGVAFRGLTVLDFIGVTSMFDRENPNWEGVWNGLSILQILTINCYGVDRCFMFALNSEQEFELWELTTNQRFDNMATPIQWIIESRSLGFKDQSEFLKQLVRTETWLEKIQGTLTYDIKYRPDRYPGWVALDNGSFCAATGLCDNPGCTPPTAPQFQYRARKISSAPSMTDCESCTDKQFRNGFEFQIRLALQGAGQVRRFRAVATEVQEKVTGGCLGDETDCCSESLCEENIWDYTSE